MKLTRQQLYELVWSMPMRDAAATIPISDVGLKKMCLRHNVPVPPRGYWNKVCAGHRMPPKPPLAPSQTGQTEKFKVFAPTPLHGEAPVSKHREIAKVRVGQDPLPTHQHSCAKEMEQLLHRMQTDSRGALHYQATTGLVHMLVWPQTLDRAIALLSRLCHAAERVGYRVSLREGQRAALVIDKEHIPFAIREKFTRPSRLLSDEEWDAVSPYRRTIGSRREYTYVASGRLEVGLDGVWIDGKQSRWSDRRSKLVETQIDNILAVAAMQAAELKERKAERERAQIAAAAAEARREQAREMRKREEERRAFLIEKADAHDEAESLANFVAHLRRKTGGRAIPPQLASFLGWAVDHVRSLREACSIDNLENDLKSAGLFL